MSYVQQHERNVERERLPNRRNHEIVEFESGGFRYVAGIGRFTDGRIAEVFLNAAKTGTAIETQARDAAITASLYFQQGGSPATLRRALTRNGDGSPSGPLGRLLDILAAHDDGPIGAAPADDDLAPIGLAEALGIETRATTDQVGSA